jgi:polyribonucleotide nucleotidyltransferase
LATLGPLDEAQQIDAYTGGSESKRFILHYNFPPFSVGETGRFGGQSRREIGHGALAERSLEPVIPPGSEFGYAIRVSSEIMESNGSTSMASVCGGTLALLDAGVPLKAPVAGISVGLVTEFDAAGAKMLRHQMLTDIIGSEDHFGDMDFKLCGTAQGVTGFQLDLKLPGLPLAMLKDAIDRATKARHDILKFMSTILPAHRSKLSPYAPQIEMLKIPQDKIGLLIGPAGLLYLNYKRDSAHGDVNQKPMDRAFILLLWLISASGLGLLAYRDTSWMSIWLAVHLGFVMSFFLTMPYGKFAHGIYRTAALLKNAIEKRQKSKLQLGAD